MKTYFHVAWIDDHKDFIHSLKDDLEGWLDSHGFTMVLQEFKDGNGVSEHLKKHDVELMVVDYNLSQGKGDALIKDLRDDNYYQDIIFYSQSDLPDGQLDGVFFVSREDVKERFKDIVKFKILKSADLATVRGWIVADAIVLETRLGVLLAKCFRDLAEVFESRVLAYPGLFDFGKKFYVLNSILKDMAEGMEEQKKDALSECRTTLNDFPKEIIEVRNTLAHQQAEITEAGQKVVRTRTRKAEVLEITPERCIQFRNDIRKHWRNLDELERLLEME